MRIIFWSLVGLALTGLITLTVFTWHALLPFPPDLTLRDSTVRKVQVLDRQQHPLTITYQNDWNIHDYVALHEIPKSLQHIFVLSEDKRFYEHGGPEWNARWHAVGQNLFAGRIIRGASTITEQVVRMLHPRPRTFWSRWVEGFEAYRLESQFSKADILEFYLNQVPYASNRRGVVQAARHYFDRDLDTLNLKEMAVLAVLVRSPSRLDLRYGNKDITPSLSSLADRLLAQQLITDEDHQQLMHADLQLHQADLPIQATHFVNHVYQAQLSPNNLPVRLHTTLDSDLQRKVQAIIDQRVHDLNDRNVHNGAVLVVDHQQNNEVLAWVNAGNFLSHDVPASQIDAIITPRQPGSTLKPFLYAMALEQGWTAATLIKDAPLSESVGTGLHSFRNYSRSYYGWLRLRDALGNSLNTPAVRTIQYVGTDMFLQQLRDLGIKSLTADANFYGDGLALGNGEVTLVELVQAYTVLANRGLFQPLRFLQPTDSTAPTATRVLFSKEASSLIADILSDSDARRLEFGSGSLLRFPVQTAIKTGTSTDYRDAWALGFNHRYTVGVWLGNLDQQPMHQVSGASGPALVLRAVFAELNRLHETAPLYLSPRLVSAEICRDNGLLKTAQSPCSSRLEWFMEYNLPDDSEPLRLAHTTDKVQHIALRQPSDALQMAMDPRIPDAQEAFALVLEQPLPAEQGQIEWLIDAQVVGESSLAQPRFLWPLQRGMHQAQARVLLSESGKTLTTPSVSFVVK